MHGSLLIGNPCITIGTFVFNQQIIQGTGLKIIKFVQKQNNFNPERSVVLTGHLPSELILFCQNNTKDIIIQARRIIRPQKNLYYIGRFDVLSSGETVILLDAIESESFLVSALD